MSERVACLFDAHNYIFRAYHGLPPMQAPDGTPTHATYGFARTVLKVLRTRQPDCVAAVFESGPSFRSELFADYKANRVEPPDDLVPQFEHSRQLAAAIGIHCVELPGYEADDLIGTLSRALRRSSLRVLIVSGDKDLAQLVGDGVTVLDIARGRELDADGVREAFGVAPAQIPDLLALTGDAVDNIPGVPGIGPKTAVRLLAAAGSVEALLAEPDRIDAIPIRGRRSVKEKLAGAAAQLRLSLELATICCDAPFVVDPSRLRYDGADRVRVERLFDAFGFGGRIRDEITRWEAPATTGWLDL